MTGSSVSAGRYKKLSAADQPEIITDCEQGSDAWRALRLGIPTASNFSDVMADGKDGNASKMRTGYLYRLAGEILTGEVAEETFRSKSMERGVEMEPEARDQFARRNIGMQLERVAFMRRKLPSGRYVGASPDSLFDKRRSGLEIKTIKPELMIPRLIAGAGIPPEHRWQVYGTMFVGELDRVVLSLFYRGMPVSPKFEVRRDERTIKELSEALEVFDHELHKLVAKVRAMGGAR